MILDSSMVEHSAVNRVVAGSSPARGAQPGKPVNINVCRLSAKKEAAIKHEIRKLSGKIQTGIY